ncbi:MAG: GNAT family N-acetyltransferase [bacterium]|nr:GNAT family N-acetyltransferase [bacterium]
MPVIRRMHTEDWPAVWGLLEPPFRAGETYAVARDISETEARQLWVDSPLATYVAMGEAGEVLGTYYIKPNQGGGGAHVCNCGYIVGEASRGRGLASLMCEHSQGEAGRLGFTAMQFNFVVSSNEGAIRLWKKLGFEIVGELPQAFRHPTLGLVNAVVMFKHLGSVQ